MSLPTCRTVLHRHETTETIRKFLCTDSKYYYTIRGSTLTVREKLKDLPNSRWDGRTKSWLVAAPDPVKTLIKLRRILRNLDNFPWSLDASSIFNRMCAQIDCKTCLGAGVCEHALHWGPCVDCSDEYRATMHVYYHTEIPEEFDEEEREMHVRLLYPEPEDWDM
jgi:hypothetical protein